jgi:hypothetical protein
MSGLPSLNLSFEKTSTSSTKLDNKNDLSNKNTINFNIMNPKAENFFDPYDTKINSPRLNRRNSVNSRSCSPYPERLKRSLKDEKENLLIESPEPYDSQKF